MNKLFFILGLIISIPAYSSSVFKYGLGVFRSAENSYSETKSASLAYQSEWFGPFIYQLEGGFWADTRGDLGRRGSGFADASAGVEVKTRYMLAQWLLGPALISHPDSMLGGPFQFNNEFVVGIKDKKDNSLGIEYRHLSSAGLELPNVGRDFCLFRVSIPW